MKTKTVIFLMILSTLVIIGYGIYERFQQQETIHQIIGEYGVQMKDDRGEDVHGISAVWYEGYQPFETRIMDTANIITLGLGFGLLLGFLYALIIHNQSNKKIKALEKRLEIKS